ncbi:MAG: RHS repeat-associated core domain-containing protein, partial [Planctomycetes bacterium]|nr:RHS repeat-associated core domain-containing protein [Planctomycetota bacterium]
VNPTQHAVHTFDHKPIDLEVIAMDRVTHPTPSRMHELVTAGGQGVTHDTQGNMLLIPTCVRANSSPLVLTWDFDNRMVSADVGADSVIDVTHQYDALGRRVARTASGSTTVFVQVDQQTICDYASGAAPASSTYRYLYGSYIDEPIVRIATSNSETTWYHRNQQYSIVACTDSTGAATEPYAYTAYGLPTITVGSGAVRTSSAIGNRYMYTGREWDGVLGQYHYRARIYEATVGRFCSRDPIGYKGSEWNLFEYVNSVPLVMLDPSGLQVDSLSGMLK